MLGKIQLCMSSILILSISVLRLQIWKFLKNVVKVSMSHPLISFCNNLKKKDKFKPMKQKKNLLIALFLTPYIFLVNICFRTEKKSYPQKKL